ncbi:MAG: PKD domain-containing protein [Desulfobulbus sp.]|nr:PKD domain-containing protein [Desulfobulbus sp.]
MHRILLSFLLTLFFCLPAYTAAASTHAIHAEWSRYSAPAGLTVSGFNLYQDGDLACQVTGARATSLDCSVSVERDTANFTLTAAFTDGTESPHSSPFTFTKPSPPAVGETTTIRAQWASYTAPSGYTTSGYNLYMEGALACQTQNARATSLDCTVSLPSDRTNFTLTAAFTNGTESPHSAPFTFNKPNTNPTPPATPLQAAITSSVTSGTVPFTVNFSGAGCTGNIRSYQWDFGDGSTATGSTANHTYTTAGSYTVQLTVRDSSNQTSVATTVINASAPVVNLPPTAAISASATSGTAPVTITFNGSGSSAGSAAITSYSWNFGDGSTGSGATASHSYTTAGTYTATLTVTDRNGLTDSASTRVVVSASGNTGNTLNAVIGTSATSGPAPLTVAFDGSGSTAASGRTIRSYAWDFGDGSTATGASTSHAYTSAGTYTATLTVTDNRRGTHSTSTIIVVSAPSNNTTLNAVISTSTAAGPAPLTVAFDGSGSTAASGRTIRSYAWDFGDGSTATGATASHAYTSAGTYTATLTVTDNRRGTSSTSTPIVVSAPVNSNKAPTAVIAATPTTGTSPLTVTFDGSGSSDPDGRITSFIWDFGDGSTASGVNTSHIYTTVGTYTATLTVTDNNGARHTTETTVVVEEEALVADINLEVGEVEVTDSWVFVRFNNTFNDPIVIAGPPSFNDTDPATVRIRNVSRTGFQIRIAEWDYLDGIHYSETVRYLVMEKGRSTLSDGTIIEAGSFTGTTSFKAVAFSERFNRTPVVLTTVVTANEADTISGRIRNIDQSRFSYYFREQERNRNTHVNETVHYIAWEPGSGTIGSLQFEVGTTDNCVTDSWHTQNHQSRFSQAPFLLADMQTTNNTDTAALRLRSNTANSFVVKVEEEQSKDYEVSHSAETVGYIAIGQGQAASAQSEPTQSDEPSGSSSGWRSWRR